jgi:transposase
MRAMRREIERADGAAAPVVSEGGQSPSMLSTGLPGMTPNPSTIGPLASGQRWSVARKREVVLRLLRGESVELVSRELGVPIYKLEQWREKADAALDGALKERESDPASGELAAAMQRIGELAEFHRLHVELGGMVANPAPVGPVGAAIGELLERPGRGLALEQPVRHGSPHASAWPTACSHGLTVTLSHTPATV